MADKVWIVIAGYNEGTVIRRVVEQLIPDWPHVVVVDDGSSDNTAAESLYGGATVVSHPINLGQGAALATGFAYALSQGASHIVTFDADGQHDAKDIQALVEAVRGSDFDVAIGSRFLGKTLSMPLRRRFLLKAAVLFTRITTGLKVTDAHNGLRCFTALAAQKINIVQNRMAHASEIIEKIAYYKLRVVEVPVTITYTAYSLAKGQSMSNSIHIVLELLLARLRK